MDVLRILFDWILVKPAMLFFDNFGFIEYALYGVFVAVLFFLLQVLCCFKLKKTALKLIPLYLVTPYSISFLMSFLSYIFTNAGSGDFFGDMSVILVLLSPPLASALLGIGFAWMEYRSIIKRKKLRLEALKQ